MEVMSSLLLCTLATLSALVPQALVSGKQVVRNSANDIKFNNTLLFHQKSKHKVLLNLNGQPMVVKPNHFTEGSCSKCLKCIRRALKAENLINGLLYERPYTVDEHIDKVIENAIKSHREKRAPNISKHSEQGEKKARNRKHRSNKHVTVTKYMVHGEIKALKVKGAITDDMTLNNDACEVFSVNESYPCNSLEGDTMLEDLEKLNVQKSKRENPVLPSTSASPQTTVKRVQQYVKRRVDNTQLPENIMSSIEEMY